MQSTKIVTSFIQNDEKILILKRSDKVKSMKNLWAGVSGIIENNEEPIKRAKIEIFEELGINDSEIELISRGTGIKVSSPQYNDHEWDIHPFLFKTKTSKIRLNWENSEYKWIFPDEVSNFKSVPKLKEILCSLL